MEVSWPGVPAEETLSRLTRGGQDAAAAMTSFRDWVVHVAAGAKPVYVAWGAAFRHEMRQVYRVAGADLQASSLQVGITLNRSERPISGNAQTSLHQLGLAIPSDPAVFDQPNRLFPRAQDGDASTVVKDSYIIFPNLQPFADLGQRQRAVVRVDEQYQRLVPAEGDPERPQHGVEVRDQDLVCTHDRRDGPHRGVHVRLLIRPVALPEFAGAIDGIEVERLRRDRQPWLNDFVRGLAREFQEGVG